MIGCLDPSFVGAVNIRQILLGYWPGGAGNLFQTSGGSVAGTGDPVGQSVDRSGYGHDLGQTGSERPLATAAGGILFDGLTQYLFTSDPIIQDSDAFTFEAVYIPAATGVVQTIICRGKDGFGGGWNAQLILNASDHFELQVVSTSGGAALRNAVGTSTISSGTPYLVRGEWQPGSFVKIFVDNVLETTSTTSATGLRSSTYGVSLGGQDSVGTSRIADGEIREPKIYNVALSTL